MTSKKIAFLFPGQGAQYCGMGKDFYDTFAVARETVEEAEDILQRGLRAILFDGPESALIETRNCQPAIYVNSMALLRVVQQQISELVPTVCAGLSLGEYTVMTASGRMSYVDCLRVVQARGEYMHEACEATKGTMAALVGLSAKEVEALVVELALPNDLWVANFNSPGQTVISGTPKGVEAGMAAAKERGARRALPLHVHGAFHSGLMADAERRLSAVINAVPIKDSTTGLVMNVPGGFVECADTIRQHLICQVTHPVRWQQSIETIDKSGVDLYVEIGCGKTLAGMNKRAGVLAPTVSVDKVHDLDILIKAVGVTTT